MRNAIIEPGDATWRACVAPLLECPVPMVLFGGQAVNLWAVRYLKKCEALRAYSPFVSKDLDALVADTAAVAESLKGKGKLDLPWRRGVKLSGLWAFFHPNGVEEGVVVDLFERINGFNMDECKKVVAGSFPLDGPLRLINPLHQLIAKAHNVAVIPAHEQKDRNDLRHVEILVLVGREFLLDTLVRAEELRESEPGVEREFINEVKSFFDHATGKTITSILRPHLATILPLARMAESSAPKIRSFATGSLPKLLAS